MSDSEYLTSDGEPCTLLSLCRLEPSWAASRIKKLEGSLAECRAELDRVKAERDAKAKDATSLMETVVGWKAIVREQREQRARADRAEARLAAVLDAVDSEMLDSGAGFRLRPALDRIRAAATGGEEK